MLFISVPKFILLIYIFESYKFRKILGFIWMLFITENWKYCSKIIFNCMNSVVRLSFNENFAKKTLASLVNSIWDPPSKNTPLKNALPKWALKFFNYFGRKNRRVHPIIFFRIKTTKMSADCLHHLMLV